MTLISFNYTADDAPASVVLSDEFTDYGVRRADTLEVIVPAGTAMNDEGGGLYTYLIEDDDDIRYEYAVLLIADGEEYRIRAFTEDNEYVVPTPDVVRLLKFNLVAHGEFTNADEPPTLSAPSENYGVATEGGEIVLTDGTNFSVIGVGQYARGFVEPDVDLRYVYYVEVQYAGVVYHLPRTTIQTNGSMLAIGRYATTYDVERIFGLDNVHKWLAVGTLDRPADYAIRAWEFLRDAEDHIDNRLRGSRYMPPMTSPIYSVITQIAATLAGVAMYEWRGAVDVDPETGRPQHRYAYQKKWATDTLDAVKIGRLRLSDDTYQRIPEFVQ